MNLFIFLDRTFDKSRLKTLIRWVFQNYGLRKALEFSERMKDIGFRMASKAGISLGVEDLLIPKEKRWLTRLAERKLKKEKTFERLGAITSFESNQVLVTRRTSTGETLKNAILEMFQEEDFFNPLYLMSFSGARGNLTQVRQLIGMRCLIVDPIGKLVEYPIRSNFKEGITLTEFLLSCYGARKGIVDTALRTARAGYLTRRLIDIAHFQVVSIRDCNTRRGIRLFPLRAQESRILVPLAQRMKGRSLSHPIPRFICRNFFLGSKFAIQVSKKYPYALFRSSLVCRAPFFAALRQQLSSLKNKKIFYKKKSTLRTSYLTQRKERRYFSLCQYCYGWSLPDWDLVHIGEAIGILAAQSIGEPGTQMTIRTFHTGGVFSGVNSESLSRQISGKVFFKKMLKGRIARSKIGQIGFLIREPSSVLLKDLFAKKKKYTNATYHKYLKKTTDFEIKHGFSGQKKLSLEQEIFLPSGILILIRHSQWVSIGTMLALVGVKDFLQEGELQVKAYRTPHRREILFENVSLKNLFSFLEVKKVIKKASLRFLLPIFSVESLYRVRTKDFSRLFLRSAGPLGKSLNSLYPFLFTWKKGDFIGNSTSITKVEIRKPASYFRTSFSEKESLFNSSYLDKKRSITIKKIFQGYRFLYYQGIYIFASKRKTYRSFFCPTVKTFSTIFWARTPIKFSDSLIVEVGFFSTNHLKINHFEISEKQIFCKNFSLVQKVQKVKKKNPACSSFPFNLVFPSKKTLSVWFFWIKPKTSGKIFSALIEKVIFFQKSELLSFSIILRQFNVLQALPIKKVKMKKFDNTLINYVFSKYFRQSIQKKNRISLVLKQRKQDMKLNFFSIQKKYKYKQYWSCLQLPWFHDSEIVSFPKRYGRITFSYPLIFCNTPNLRKKQVFLWNKQKRVWKTMKTPMFFWFLKKDQNQIISVSSNKNLSYSIEKNSFIGFVSLGFRTFRKLIFSRLFRSSQVPKNLSTYSWSLEATKQHWKYSCKNNDYIAILSFLTKRPAEIHWNSILGEFFLLQKEHLKAYIYPLKRSPLFLGCWQSAPIHRTGQVGPKRMGQTIAFGRSIVIFRTGTRLVLESDRFLSWQPGSIICYQRPLTATRGRRTQSGDITSGIPRVEALLEIRSQTGIPNLLKSLYQSFLKKDFLNRVAVRKSLHFCQRVIIDGVLRIYQTNRVILDDKHLELIVRPISFVQVIQDNARTNSIVQGENHPLENLERINWQRALDNWQKKESFREWKPKALYKPLLFGLTKRALRNTSFLSAASFQETSRVLAQAAVRRRIDPLHGLKENLILGTRLPIGTNDRFQAFNLISIRKKNVPKTKIRIKEKMIAFVKKSFSINSLSSFNGHQIFWSMKKYCSF
nr:beta'' subunit of RNA polymerase [Dinophyceae sp. MRD-151]